MCSLPIATWHIIKSTTPCLKEKEEKEKDKKNCYIGRVKRVRRHIFASPRTLERRAQMTGQREVYSTKRQYTKRKKQGKGLQFDDKKKKEKEERTLREE